MFGVNQRTVTRWQNRAEDPLPVAVRGSRGTANSYNINALHEWGVRQRIADLTIGESGDGYDLDLERARLTHHQANKTALEEQQLDGVLIRADLVEQQWSAVLSALKSHLMGMPVRLAQVCVASGHTLREVEESARAEIYQALTELISDATEQALGTAPDHGAVPGEAAPAAETDGGGVGG